RLCGRLTLATVRKTRSPSHPTGIPTLRFSCGRIRPAHFHADAEVEHDAGKRRIPFRHDPVTAPWEGDRLRPIKTMTGNARRTKRDDPPVRAPASRRAHPDTRETSTERKYFRRDARIHL